MSMLTRINGIETCDALRWVIYLYEKLYFGRGKLGGERNGREGRRGSSNEVILPMHPFRTPYTFLDISKRAAYLHPLESLLSLLLMEGKSRWVVRNYSLLRLF